MDGYVDVVRRQGLGGLGGFLPGDGDPTNSGVQAAGTTTSSTFDLGGVIGALTTIADGIPTIVSSPLVSSSLESSTTPTSTHSSSSSTGSTSSTSEASSTTPTPLPSTSITTSKTSTNTPSMTSASASTSMFAPTLTATPIVHTSSDGTSIVYVTSFADSTSSPTSAPPTSFLQNKPLETGIFTFVGIVILIIIFVIVTFTMRRRRRDRLENDIADAVTFDPSMTEHFVDEENRMNTIEKYTPSDGSSGHGHGFGYAPPQLAYAPPSPPQYGYRGQGYEQQATHRVPLPQVPSHSQDNPINTGGANLTRKYSDRKPVPPLLPNPVYDPSRSPVLSTHFYGQENLPPTMLQLASSSAPAPDETTPASSDHFDGDPYTGVLKIVNH